MNSMYSWFFIMMRLPLKSLQLPYLLNRLVLRSISLKGGFWANMTALSITYMALSSSLFSLMSRYSICKLDLSKSTSSI